MLTDEFKSKVSLDVNIIRDIAQYIAETTNIKNELIFDMANAIYLKRWKV